MGSYTPGEFTRRAEFSMTSLQTQLHGIQKHCNGFEMPKPVVYREEPTTLGIYIAGRYHRRDEFRGAAKRLNEAGIKVTSRWLDETHDVTKQTHQVMSDAEQLETAMVDLWDVDAAEAVIFYAEEPYNQPPRGGRHVEFGYALARSKRIYVVGEHENIFHHHPRVSHHATLDQVLEAINASH